MPTKEEMEEQGTFNRWLAAYQATRQALSDTIINLNNALLTTLPEDQPPIQLQITLQQQKINALDNERLLFYAGKITMTPPSNTTITHLKEFATQADKMVNNAKASNQIIQVADRAVSVYEAAVHKKTA